MKTIGRKSIFANPFLDLKKLFKVKKGHEFRQKAEYDKLKSNGIHRYHPPAQATSDRASVRVIFLIFQTQF